MPLMHRGTKRPNAKEDHHSLPCLCISWLEVGMRRDLFGWQHRGDRVLGFFSSRQNWDPSPAGECFSPFGSGGTHSLAGGGWGVPIPTWGQTLWYSRYTCIYFVGGSVCSRVAEKGQGSSEPQFVNLLRSPGIDSQRGGPVRQPYLTYRLSESIPWLLKRLQIRVLYTSFKIGRTNTTYWLIQCTLHFHSLWFNVRE